MLYKRIIIIIFMMAAIPTLVKSTTNCECGTHSTGITAYTQTMQ